MRSRSSGRAAVDDSPPTSNKRPYNRKALLCRLCLRVLAKEDLLEIFTGNNNLQKAIRAAVSVEVNRKDRSIRLCQSCLDLVYTINDFRTVCEKSAALLSQNVQIPSGTFWADESDQKVFAKCRALVEQCKTEIEKLFLEKSDVCCDDTNDSFEESVTLPVEPSPTEEVDIKSVKNELPVKAEALNIDILSDVDDDDDVGLDIDDTCSLKLEQESETAFIGFTDPESEAENNEQKEDTDPDFIAKPKRSKKNSSDPPRRRGRPILPDEMLKRRRRIPGEPKRKPGPKNRIKLPAQSVCEICGLLVNRENQERHRNDHLGHRPYPCTVEGCSRSFSSKAGLLGHLARHADRDNIYDCDICGAKIKTKSSLQRHRKMHVAEKPHACDICGKRFWRKSYLNHHSTVHTGVAKFPCEYCGFVFKNKYWRSFHIKQKHVAKGEEPKFQAQDELDENGDIPQGLVTEISIEFA
ncbi:zinc finger protein 239-like [Topomyia yanbarensis]|uniref:zinc finger protein 239-like n=1 Tax=Topomyia yanbarensis TaxID=2498891 RepID=UPI00273C2322|nr:zinc finger protein 239-like [Topomyia yanbarensis]XP_058840725.1 zinc finger protein 239-like [Topomyia yanbarensis]